MLLQQGLPQGKYFHFSNELSSFLIKLTLNELWAARNLGTFESKRPPVQTIISKIKARIRIVFGRLIISLLAPTSLSRGRIAMFSVPTKTKR